VNPASDDETYTYDAFGNRLTASGVNGNWTYNQNNELLGHEGVTFAYDDNGNMTRKTTGTDVSNYIYDVENRLIRVEDDDGSLIAQYYYDPFGRRLWKDVGGLRTCYFYADEGLIGDYDGSGNEIRTYGYVPNSTWTADPLFQKAGGTYYWYQNDHLGTPQKIVDTSGRVVWSATYDSFGNMESGVVEIENNLRFPGQYYDAETGLYYNWNRYYDPATGRYESIDLLGDETNRYSYISGNPINFCDPLGLCKIREHFGRAKRAWDDPNSLWNLTWLEIDEMMKNDHPLVEAVNFMGWGMMDLIETFADPEATKVQKAKAVGKTLWGVGGGKVLETLGKIKYASNFASVLNKNRTIKYWLKGDMIKKSSRWRKQFGLLKNISALKTLSKTLMAEDQVIKWLQSEQ